MTDFPADNEISCLARPKKRGTTKKLDSSTIIWNEKVLNKSTLESALIEFNNGQRGAKAKILRISGLTAKELDNLLRKEGFRHQRVVLSFDGPSQQSRPIGSKGKSGSKSIDPKSETWMDIYDHKDGSVFRIKAFGVPDPSGKAIRPQPQAIKSVVFDKTTEKCSVLGIFSCHLDTSWENEAFKVSEAGQALPKSPKPEHGINLPAELTPEQKNTWIDRVMDFAHVDLKVSWNHCQ